MDQHASDNTAWNDLTPEEKRRRLYDKQVDTLKKFLERGAISQEQFDKSYGDLTEKMGYGSGK